MENVEASSSSVRPLRGRKPVPLVTLGAVISGLLILNGLLFRTYGIAMTSPAWETARQYGIPYIFVEIAVVIYALRKGLNISELWSNFPQAVRYCICIFVSTFWIGGVIYSEYPLRATTQNFIFLVHALFACAVYHIVGPVSVTGLRKLALTLVIGLAAFSAITAFAFLNHPPLASMPDNQILWQYVIPGFVSVRLFGAFCAAIFCFLYARLLLEEEAGHRQLWPYVALTLAAAMTLWSGTRNGVLGIVIVMGVMMIVHGLRPTGRKSLVCLCLSVAVAAGLAIMLIPFGDPAFMLIASQDTATTESISGGRASYWTALWNAYATVPMFGAGPYASYWIVPDDAQKHVQPHNFLIQFLLSWGLPATVAALYMLAYVTWKSHVITMQHRIVIPFLAMFDSLLVMSFFDGTFHFAQTLILIMISLGVLFSATKKSRRETNGVHLD